MRVLVSPGAQAAQGLPAREVAEALAGPEGMVVALADEGVRTLGRPLSAADVELLRRALLGVEPASRPASRVEPANQARRFTGRGVVGYVCTGRLVSPAGEGAIAVVEDHANLTWRSPLVGPNDDQVGPRFPVMTGVYAPEVARERVLADSYGMIVSGVAAGVQEEAHLNPF
ncbi:MAG: hypothetical protein H5T84_04465, partial [Thermoleophilia bacterium]|nr:hypothetical protein [Thermoleophilia bacterium]